MGTTTPPDGTLTPRVVNIDGRLDQWAQEAGPNDRMFLRDYPQGTFIEWTADAGHTTTIEQRSFPSIGVLEVTGQVHERRRMLGL